MPYAYKKKGNKWITYNKDTGDIKGTHDTEHGAIAQMRLLYGIKGGMKPTGKKGKKFRVRRKRKA